MPLMAMVRHRQTVGSSVPARLLYSARALHDVIYREELESLGALDAGLDVVVTLTREQPECWPGRSGRVNDDLLAEIAWPPDERPLVFVCGPTGFVEAVAAGLVRLGHDPLRVKTERFGATG